MQNQLQSLSLGYILIPKIQIFLQKPNQTGLFNQLLNHKPVMLSVQSFFTMLSGSMLVEPLI